MFAELQHQTQTYRVISDQRQRFTHGRPQPNALTYREVRWIVFTPPAETFDREFGELAVAGSENTGTMLIPQPLILSLFFFVADTFPDLSSPASLDVNELIARAKHGDRNAVSTLYQVYSQAIFRYVACRVPTNADAEDLTAEVFVSMVKGLPAYQVTGAPFESWLYRIATSRVADYYRKSSRSRQSELSETLVDHAPLPEEQILQNQSFELLREALRQLPEDHQSILILRFVERKSHEEVAELLDKSVSAVKSAQYRALKRLTELLGSDQKVRHYIRGSSHE